MVPWVFLAWGAMGQTSGAVCNTRGKDDCLLKPARSSNPSFTAVSLKRQLSQPSPGATPTRKAPRLTLCLDIPSSPDGIPTAPTIVSPSAEDVIPCPSAPRSDHPFAGMGAAHSLDPAALVQRLEDLAEEYARTVDEMGAEIQQSYRESRKLLRR